MLSRLLAFGCAACMVAAVYLYLRFPRGQVGLVVEEPARILKGLSPGKVYEIEFRVHNRTGETRRVVGGPPFS